MGCQQRLGFLGALLGDVSAEDAAEVFLAA